MRRSLRTLLVAASLIGVGAAVPAGASAAVTCTYGGAGLYFDFTTKLRAVSSTVCKGGGTYMMYVNVISPSGAVYPHKVRYDANNYWHSYYTPYINSSQKGVWKVQTFLSVPGTPVWTYSRRR